MTNQTRAELRATRRARANKIITPAFRRWAYGLTAAALTTAIGIGWLPAGYLPVLLPLAMALFFVDKAGEPR